MELIIVTGLSGAGKSVALDSLEDMGYYCIDNMPPALIDDFIDLIRNSRQEVEKAAICMDARTGQMYQDLEKQITMLSDIDCRIIFLEASDETLIRRYNETRRNHPLSQSSIREGIDKEKEFLARARKISDNIIDTSNMKSANLKGVIKDIVAGGQEDTTFIVNIISFGYKYGMPMEADMVMDMRFIPNPFYIPELKEHTGNEKPVADYVLSSDAAKGFIDRMIPTIEQLIPQFEHEGKYHLNLACGCTGGHHRSVAMANEFARILKDKGYRITLTHRDI